MPLTTDASRFAICVKYANVLDRAAVSSTSAEALVVGPPAAPTLVVDASATGAGAGVLVEAALAGGAGPSVAVISTAANESLQLVPKGSGQVTVPSSLTVTGTIYGTLADPPTPTYVFPSLPTPATSSLVLNDATSGGTFIVSSTMGLLSLPAGSAAVGRTWRFIVAAGTVFGANAGVTTVSVSGAPALVGQLLFTGGGANVVACDSRTSTPAAFNTISFLPSAVAGDWIEVYGITPTLMGFRAWSSTSSSPSPGVGITATIPNA